MDDIKALQIFDRVGAVDIPEVKDLALKIYETGFASHQCYWNDRLYIAFRFDLDKEHKKRAIINSIIFNGSIEYFEGRTHFGFDNKGLLSTLGVPDRIIPGSFRVPYDFLSSEIREIVAKNFGIDIKDKKELLRVSGEDYQEALRQKQNARHLQFL